MKRLSHSIAVLALLACCGDDASDETSTGSFIGGFEACDVPRPSIECPQP